MENRFEQTPPEEKQAWGAYATPPPTVGQQGANSGQTSRRPILPGDHSMCQRVQDTLPLLMENGDSELSQETVRVLYGHLSICADCSREFDEQQRIVSVLESMPALEMPMDFTGAIARRIQLQQAASESEAVVTPIQPRSIVNSVIPELANAARAAAIQNAYKPKQQTVSASSVNSASTKTRTATKSSSKLENYTAVQRMTAGTIAAAVMGYFVSSNWGREMLGANLATAKAWVAQMAATLEKIPVFGRLALLVFAALAQIGTLLGDTYRNVGDMAVHGLAMDIGVCIAGY